MNDRCFMRRLSRLYPAGYVAVVGVFLGSLTCNALGQETSIPEKHPMVERYRNASATIGAFLEPGGRSEAIPSYVDGATANLPGMVPYSSDGTVTLLGHEYQFKSLDVPGSVTTQVNGLNDHGDVVGYFVDAQGATHGFIWKGGFSTIDVPDAAVTKATGINDSGQISGIYSDAGGIQHGFLLAHGQFTQLSFPSAVDTGALGLNNRGDIVGGFDFGDQNTEIAFLSHKGDFTSFEDPIAPASSTEANAINDLGQIVGVYVDANGTVHPYLLIAGRFSTIDFPGATAGGEAEGINNRGQIAGRYFGGPAGNQGFILSNSRFTTVSFPSAAVSAVRKINNNGVIIGIYRQRAGQPAHGFIALPVAPQPTNGLRQCRGCGR